MNRQQLTEKYEKMGRDELFASPFPAVYDKNAPRVREGERLLYRELCGGLRVYIRFIITGIEDEGIGSIVATEQNIAAAHVDAEHLFTKAMENAQAHGIMKTGLESLVRQLLCSDDCPASETEPEQPEYPQVLRINTPCYGAGVLALHSVMRQLYREHGELLILPSSVHEVIILPSHMIASLEAIEMVRQINRDVLDPREILSDDVFLFDEDGFHRVHVPVKKPG